MARDRYAVFVAGGSGTRMGSDIPKQFLLLDGKPILQRSIEAFVEAVPDLKIIVVLSRTCIAYWKEFCLAYSFDVPHLFVSGGLTRFHSVRNALEKVPDGALVAIHDGVRPLISPALVRTLFEKGETCPAVIPVIPVTDTLRYRNPALGDADREALVAVQTPQIFHSEALKAAYNQAYETAFTDDGSVVRKYGIPLTLEEGERFNIKITTPEDLVLASAILSSR